jgi:hypothetical protein
MVPRCALDKAAAPQGRGGRSSDRDRNCQSSGRREPSGLAAGMQATRAQLKQFVVPDHLMDLGWQPAKSSEAQRRAWEGCA